MADSRTGQPVAGRCRYVDRVIQNRRFAHEPTLGDAMRVPRVRFTIRRLMIAVEIVAVTLAVVIASWDQILILFAGLLILAIVLGPIALQLVAIYWRDTP